MGISSTLNNSTCPAIASGPQYGVEHVVGSLTFHDLTQILCGAFAAVALVISGIQLSLHATHFSNPGEQTKILRIISLVPVFALVYMIGGFIPSDSVYFQPWANFYESVALASYFLLLIAYVVPNPERRASFFDRLEHKKGGSSLVWYRRTWICVFQYIPVSFGVAIATDITQAVGILCPNGDSVHFAHIWLTVISSVSVTLSFLRLLAFYKRLRPQLTEHNVVAKLLAIKGIVFVVFLQQIIFTILNSTGALKPSSKFTYNDIYYGIPSILLCGEMIFFALFNYYAYSVKPYSITSSSYGAIESQKPGGAGSLYFGGPLGARALLMALNPIEVLRDIVQGAKYVVSSPKVQHYDGGVGMQPLHNPPQYHPVVPQRAHSPSSMEYGSVEAYTPLPRR